MWREVALLFDLKVKHNTFFNSLHEIVSDDIIILKHSEIKSQKANRLTLKTNLNMKLFFNENNINGKNKA